MKNKTLYISTFINESTYESLSPKAKKTVAFSMSLYAERIRKGLESIEHIHLECIFTPVIGPFKSSGVLYYSPRNNYTDPKGKYLTCINIQLLKQLSVFVKLLVFTVIWSVKNFSQKDKTIVLSSIQPSYLAALLLPRLLGSRILLFVPDLPSVQYGPEFTKSKLVKILLPFYNITNALLLKTVDYFVFISKYMINKFPQRPFCIMEGLVEKEVKTIKNSKKNAIFTVLYAGGLIESMGISNLLEAIKKCNIQNIQFVFFGRGPLAAEIEKLSENDKRVRYGGVVSNHVVVEEETRAHLLINPRPIEAEYTMYSFPSKLMEYMQSGTPVLTSKLLGIPEDYYDKMLFIEDSSSDGILDSINKAFMLEPFVLEEIGKKARNYVNTTKNYKVQIKRIVDDFSKQVLRNDNSMSSYI